MLAVGVVISVIMLGYFKYTNFFLSEWSLLIGEVTPVKNIILPIGISFYTFSGMAYLIDIYRGDYLSEKNILNVALYIAFFVKLTAGPIVRGNVFLPQLKHYQGIVVDDVLDGVQIFVFGLFKKIVLAGHLCVFVDNVFYAPTAYNTGTVILAVVSYSLQIYFDFSGYSDMAVGMARILGFRFDRNFNLPYIATNMSDFWKRWHISLSSWFLDYLYIPLGGSRKGTFRKYVNLMIVMLISGLWHGVGVTFIIWGALHGVASCISNCFEKKDICGRHFSVALQGVKISVTYIIVALLWVVFRADSWNNAVAVYKSIFTVHSGISQPYTWTFFAIACLLIGTYVAYRRACKIGAEEGIEGFYPIMNLRIIYGMTVFLTFCGLTILMGYFGNTVFIYGRF